MSFNKDIFEEHFKNMDYTFCVTILRSEIIDILSKKIQAKNPNFTYSTITALQKNCFNYLSEKEQEIVTELYDFTFGEDAVTYELSRMLELYKQLI